MGTCTSGQLPDVLATADMQAGMTGTAWTVVQGTTPVSFNVQILGVEHDLILPGHAFVLAAGFNEQHGLVFLCGNEPRH